MPLSLYWYFLEDKFCQVYSKEITTDGDGSFIIDASNFPDEFFNQYSGDFELTVKVNEDDTDLVSFNGPYGDDQQCIQLSFDGIAEPIDLLPDDAVYGCSDPLATNYNPDATVNDGSCEYEPFAATITATDTGEDIDRMQYGIGGENMHTNSGNDLTEFDIFDTGFCTRIDLFGFEFYKDAGSIANKYLRRFVGDRPDAPVPAAPPGRGGYNTLVDCAKGAGLDHTYSVSFWSNDVKWCLARGYKMILSCNLNDFDVDAYADNINYTDAQVGFLGLDIFQEYESPAACESALSADGPGCAIAAGNLISGLGSLLTGKIRIRDWKGINNPDYPLTDAYTDAIIGIDSTSTRIYISPDQLMFKEEFAFGRTIAEYLASIDYSIDVTMENRIADLVAIINQPVAITQLFSYGKSGYAGTFLQFYEYSRTLLKVITIEALNTGSIELSMMHRVDMLDLKTQINTLGKTLLKFKNFYTAGNKIHIPTLPTGMYGAVSVDGTNHGTMIVINSTSSALEADSVTVNAVQQPFLSVSSIVAGTLGGKVSLVDGEIVPPFSINEVTF